MKRGVVLFVAVLLAGCGGSPTVPEEDRSRLGVLTGLVSDQVLVSTPASVRAGHDFNVQVRTYGFDLCWTIDRTEVDVEGATARVTPYDLPSPEGTGCLTAIAELDHTATLRFEEPGPATIRFRGLRFTNTEVQQIEVVREVTVK